jgi:DNA-binding SARP family transcriptional activator
MQAVLPLALEQRIEPDVARGLIRDFAIPAPLGAPESWPWALRIYTLGRFEILVNDSPLTFGRKAPKRTIALLKALIAFGGTAVGEQRLADALWPDLEGDAALESLAAALHRLRRLLGTNDVIRQSGGNLSLDSTLCFVDAQAFEAMLELPGRQAAALDLYRGNFLHGEPDAPWSASLRERLRARFVRGVEAAGADLEDAGEHSQAAALYRRGIDTDELVEAFYRGLMRCLVALGRPAEAAAAFRRLRQTLSVTLGASPSPETRKLFETLPLA